MNNIECLKNRIQVVRKEMEEEKSKNKKKRLNTYKQKLEIALREETRLRNMTGIARCDKIAMQKLIARKNE